MKKLLLLSVLFAILFASFAAANNSINILNASAALSGNVQQTVTGSFDLNNTGTTTISVSFANLTLTAAGSRSLTINPISSVNNLAGGSVQTVTFTTPLSNSFATTYTGQILASVATNASAVDNLPVSIVVNPASALTASLPGVTVAKGLSKSTLLTLTNSGNTDLNPVTLSVGTISSGSSVLPASSISLSKTSTSISFGLSDTVTVTINPPSTQASGTYSGPITISFAGTSITATLSVAVRDAVHSVKFNVSELKVGSSTQERNTTQNTAFIIENDGDFTEIVAISTSNVPSNFNTQFSKTSTTLAPGATDSITLTLSIPLSQDSGVRTIGQAVLSFSGTSNSKDIKLETASKLKIEDVDVKVDGRTSSNLNDGDTIGRDAQPEDDLEFDIPVKNLFSSSSNIDINDIEIKVTIQDIDDGDDLDDDKSNIDANAGSDEKAKFKFKVPLQVDEDTYIVLITAEGDDDNGATHISSVKIRLKVNKESDDVRITKSDLTSDTLSCVRSSSIRVEIRNFGSDDQDDAAVVAVNRDIGLNARVDDINLDSNVDDDDNRFSRTFDFTVPESVRPGTYQIEVITFINNNNEMDKKLVPLRVQSCTSEPTPGTRPNTPNTTVVVTPPPSNPPVEQPAEPVDSVEVPFTQSNAFLGLLGLGYLVVLGALVFLIAKLFV